MTTYTIEASWPVTYQCTERVEAESPEAAMAILQHRVLMEDEAGYAFNEGQRSRDDSSGPTLCTVWDERMHEMLLDDAEGHTIAVSDEEHATILAALRYYQKSGMGDPDNRSDGIHDIATNGDAVISLDDAGIDDLCERIN